MDSVSDIPEIFHFLGRVIPRESGGEEVEDAFFVGFSRPEGPWGLFQVFPSVFIRGLGVIK